ncbi:MULTISPECIES: helix-turn-helix domain-containing protein [Vagococcus]|uniref:Transcriptional regulator, AraC family n=1 Tax=Vagococcus fluvialis bH819 TaxID=1255619 RepID=A0A1X6WKQ9_9ENTE|nr:MULTISPECIES: helix-turn-helix domain-containing protein [Vagococcus]SLM84837.1 Transcriptional regulator, AraC family [Vagococcus fluvialis bH819]HCM89144.1 AraC family transcriptional regulator [Vagococcus sp.]
MKPLTYFLKHLTEITNFSYLLINKKTQETISQKNLTDITLSDKQLTELLKPTTTIFNYYLKEQHLLLMAYNMTDEAQLLLLFIDDEINRVIYYNDQLLKIAEMIHLFVTERPFSKKEILSINQNILYLKESVIDKIISQKIEQEIYHHDYESEEALFLELMNGNQERLISRFYSFQKYSQLGKLSTESKLRNKKNILIVTVAVSTRYAIRGGVPSERAYTLSDKIIQEIEKKSFFKKDEPPELDIMLLFTKEVIKYQHINYSPTIKKTCEFIQKNTYTKLSVPMIADYANYSVPHLSALFKQEVGLSLNQYVMKQKIEESKRLLAFNQYDMSTISSLLNFTDVSYFIKVFKKYVGLTPKEYCRGKRNI